jgi:hypothetical protein
MALERFASHTEDEKIKQRHTNVPVNTEQNNKKVTKFNLTIFVVDAKLQADSMGFVPTGHRPIKSRHCY